MTSTTLLPLHFATHLFSLTVAIAAAYVFARRTGRSRVARGAGAVGFLTLAAEQILHGAAVLPETSPTGAFIRTTGYVLILGAGLLARGGSLAGLVALSPAPVIAPAASALAAGIALAWKTHLDRSHAAMAAGLVMLGAGESFLALEGVSGSVVLAHVLRTVGWGIVAAGVMAASRRSIRFRFVATFVAVLLVVVLAVSSSLTRVIGDNLRREAARSVAAETTALAERFEPQAVNAAERALATAQGVVQAIGSSPEELTRILGFVNRTLRDLDFVMVVSRRGALLAQTGQALTVAEAQAIARSDPVLFARDRHQLTASVDAVADGEMLIIAAAPVSALQASPYIVVGYRVDNALLEFLAPASLAFVVQGDQATASTLPGVPPGHQVPAELAARIRTQALSRGETFTTSAEIAGSQYFLSVRPLERTDGRIIGALVGAQPAEILEATQQGVNRVLFLVTLGAVAVAILLSSLFGRRFTRPVRQLTAAARQVQAGDLTAKAEVTGEDEVGDLAIAFNRMTSSLSSTTESLQRAVEEETRVRDQLETVLNSMGDGLVAVDAEGKILTINPAAERIAGLSRKAIGRPVSEVLVGRTGDGRALASKENPSGQLVLRRKGTDVPVAISSAPIKGGSGEMLGRVFVIRDRSREAEVERVKREFLATVSHELRTPLTPIVGYAELLTRREFDVARVEEFARGILSSARRMERIVGMLLDYSAIEAGRMPVEPEAVALRPLVTRAVEEWRERAPDHDFVTRFSAAPPALIDVPLFRRTMDELLDNAVKYSPNGGTITVSVRPNGRIHGKAAVQVDVADQGIGILANQLPGIFQDFRQIDGSDTRAFGGLGLGLAFVKRIVQAHRGTINAESKPGVGTTFKIGLPAADPDSEVSKRR